MKRFLLPHLLVIFYLYGTLCGDTASAIRDILAVDGEGKGNVAAAKAWGELSKGEASTIPALLAARRKTSSTSTATPEPDAAARP